MANTLPRPLATTNPTLICAPTPYSAGNNIGPMAIPDFFGSLDQHKAAKGLRVTTSTFPPKARETAEFLSKLIVLIDGEQPTTLMIRDRVGCRLEETLHIKKIDEDFFE